MSYLKHRLLVWWVTLVVILAGSFMPAAHSSLNPSDDASKTAITLEICGPKGERLSYTITFDDSDSHTSHASAHCLFCILPASIAAIIESTPALRLVIFETIETISFPPYVHVPTQLDRWLPHRALAPPAIV
ncbi:MAG: DUF2946 domain-containing protein [Alcaligenaceae bacterium]|nr:DUF2946 domain-containing protein [Alcaligenaceae bacterium]